VHVLAKKNP
jgi:hypothetical protein